MRIVLSQQGWVFDGLSGLEWLFLRRLPAVVDELSLDDGARLRLFPDPIREKEAREGSGTDEDEAIVDDWKEYVRPDMETVFDEACRSVAVDLEAVRQSVSVGKDDDEVDPEKVFYSLEVPGEHVEQWNSTLNQARILMNEVHALAESERELAEGLMDLPEEGDPGDEGRSRQASAYPQWLLLAQYGFYGAIQSFLIEQVMDV